MKQNNWNRSHWNSLFHIHTFLNIFGPPSDVLSNRIHLFNKALLKPIFPKGNFYAMICTVQQSIYPYTQRIHKALLPNQQQQKKKNNVIVWQPLCVCAHICTYRQLTVWKTIWWDEAENPGFMAPLLNYLSTLHGQFTVFGGSQFSRDYLVINNPTMPSMLQERSGTVPA